MSFEQDAIPTPSPFASAVEVDGETVLLDKTTGRLHQLNYVGAAIWSRLDGSRTFGSIVDELSDEFGADPDSVARDVEQFLSELGRLGLLGREGAAEEPRRQHLHAPPGRLSAIDTVWVDWYTAQVVEALRSRGIEAILLKGPAIRRWLYDDAPGERGYIDADLLVQDRSLGAAAALLNELGFTREDPGGMEAINVWATTWRRDTDGAVVDLHRTLHGCEHSMVDPWPILRANAVEDEVGGSAVLLPSIAARAVQLALLSPADRPWRKWDDLRRALDRLPIERWREAAAVARSLGVERLFGYRLSQSPEGLELAKRLGVATAPAWWLRWEGDPMLRWIVLLAALPSWRLRMRLARQLLMPSASYVRFRDPEAARRGLAASYAAWVIHVLRLMPGAAVTLLRSIWRLGVRG